MDFGTATQYPVLDFGSHVLTKQRATVSISPSPTTIWERADTGLSRVNATTISAALSGAWEDDITVTLSAVRRAVHAQRNHNLHTRRLHERIKNRHPHRH